MAYILEKIGNTYNLPKKYFTCDAKSDLDGINLVDVPIGSEAYCILEEESYILNSNKQWHKKKIGEDLTGQVQADLSQTDSTQADYVKGVLRTEHLPEGYPYKEIGTILDGTFEFVDSGLGFYKHQIMDENFTIVDGRSYTVIWDGVTYQCVATTIMPMPDESILVLGNLAVADAVADTGEPFLFMDQGDGQKAIATNNTAATHTITVRGEIVYPIAPEFLPDGYPYKSRGVALSKTTVQIETTDKPVDLLFAINFIERSLYEVVWDGIAYEVIAANIENAIAIGNAALAGVGDDTGEPFDIASIDGRTILFAETAGSHTISIIGETIHPMATEFLPDKYVTETELASKRYITETELASKGYLTSYTETDPTVPAWAKAKTKPSYDFSELTVNNPEAAKTALAIEKGMIFKNLQAAMPSSKQWVSIAYGNGKFVSVASSRDKAAYSEDGITWTETTLPASVEWTHITYGNGKFIAVAKDTNIFIHSEDGITWTQSSLPLSGKITNIAYSDGKFVMAFAGTTTAIYSTDGITWTETTLPASVEWTHITYGNGKFIIIVYGQHIAAYSTDGITWIQTTVPSSVLLSVAYGNNKFVALGIGEGAYSEDGITWTRMNLPSGQWGAICSSDKFVAISTSPNAKSMYSIDGITWIETTLPVKDWKYGIAYGDGKFVIPYSGLNGSTVVLHSFDGITWHDSIQCLSQNNSNITEDVRSVIGIPAYSTANNGQFLRVIDGIPTWTEFLPTLTSPNGTKYQLTVSDDGTLSAVAQS